MMILILMDVTTTRKYGHIIIKMEELIESLKDDNAS